jgi:hypothetical protein
LRARYGTGTPIVVSVPEATGTFADAARAVVNERSDPRVHLWTTPIRRSTGLGATGTSRPATNRLIADKLRDYLAGLSQR